jgi:ATP-dependent DNA helicase RecQ
MKDRCLEVLKERFHFPGFREGQEEIIRTLLSGRDAVVVMPTGSGKSLCYQLPALLLDGVTLVVSPLIALMKDQVDGLEANRIPATFINSQLVPSEQAQRLREVLAGRFKLVYIAPERFRNQGFMQGIRSCPIGMVAVDEAHCVSEWGHDFRPDYLRLKEAIGTLGRPPVVALTATATPEVRRDIILQLGLRKPASFVAGFDRPNLRLQVVMAGGEDKKIAAIHSLLREGFQCGIIYAATRKNVEAVTQALMALGYRIEGYHAGMEMERRRAVQDRFMDGTLPIVAATNAFGMGIDRADLRFVVHYDIPGSIEAYYQEVGRAGRDGKAATCLLLFNYADTFTQEFFIDGSYPPREMVEEVYRILCAAGTDEIEITHKGLAGRLQNTNANEMAVASCLKILEKAGYIERGMGGQHLARITCLVDPAQWRSQSGPSATRSGQIAAYCLDILGASKGVTLSVDLEAMAGDLSFAEETLRRTLSGLHAAGTVEYRPPFRGRGLKILERVPVSALNVNFPDLERRSDLERQKLRRMIDYAYSPRCLRRFILEYFGEEKIQNTCGNCSYCLPRSGSASAGELGLRRSGRSPRIGAPWKQKAPGKKTSPSSLPAPSTVEVTWALWEKGNTVKDIADKRNLTTTTIAGHLTELISAGRPVDLGRILSRERMALIEEAVSRAGGKGLAPIKALLPAGVSYDEIRLVMSGLASKVERR